MSLLGRAVLTVGRRSFRHRRGRGTASGILSFSAYPKEDSRCTGALAPVLFLKLPSSYTERCRGFKCKVPLHEGVFGGCWAVREGLSWGNTIWPNQHFFTAVMVGQLPLNAAEFPFALRCTISAESAISCLCYF